jgi:diadenosine tetraphosphatase ApaH/serine/threonine PP2A family protein phosphatase
MRAILSDIHGNLEALQAVLKDAADHGAREIYCLGDTVGYGPNPIECLELATKWKVVLLGNVDLAAISDDDLTGWSAVYAAQSVFKFRRLLDAHPNGDRLRQYLASRPRSFGEGTVTYVHGSPRNLTNEYIFPEDIYNTRKMQRISELFDRLCFCGHTHIPGIFEERAPDSWTFHAPPEINWVYRPGKRQVICNVGSVGQPRDKDPRACYVLFDGQEIRFRRMDYDLATSIRKIHDDPDLNDFLGDRLSEGN